MKRMFIKLEKEKVLFIDLIKKKREIISVVKRLNVEMLKFNIEHYTSYDSIKLNVNTHI